jgi:cell cycle arrest protein BUB3
LLGVFSRAIFAEQKGMADASSPAEILAPPSDGVTSLRFAHAGNKAHLLVSSWDAVLRVYEGVKLRAKVETDAPLLACAFGGADSEAFAGSLDGRVLQADLSTRQTRALGSHAAAVRHTEYTKEYGLLVSGGWDGAVKLWDIRSAQGAQLHTVHCGAKVFGMDLRSHLLVVATSARRHAVYDLRNVATPLLEKESPLKFQTRCVRVMPNLRGFALSSIEGRVALEYWDDSHAVDDARSYAFKCHREKVESETRIYPVNALAFHPTLGTFATGGCDGVVNIWDGDNKKRISHLPKFPTSIAALDFNHDGSVLAVASSYTYEEGEKEYVDTYCGSPEAWHEELTGVCSSHPNDAIFLHAVQPNQVRPKVKP